MHLPLKLIFKFPFWIFIMDALPLTDVYNIKTLVKDDNILNRLEKYIRRRCKLQINNRLQSIFGHNFDEFRQIMVKQDVVISGSFIIQCLLDEYWKTYTEYYRTDIDIYMVQCDSYSHITRDDYPDYRCTPPRCGYSDIENFMHKNFEYLYSNRGGHVSYMRSLGDKIARTTEYDVSESLNIQIIHTIFEKDKIPFKKFFVDFIKQNSDFDICKNVYYYDQKKAHLHIHNLEQILFKKTEFKYTNNIYLSIERYLKYKFYGFTFTNNRLEMLNDIVENAHHSSLTRSDKHIYELYEIEYIETLWIPPNLPAIKVYKILKGNIKQLQYCEKFGEIHGITVENDILKICDDNLDKCSPNTNYEHSRYYFMCPIVTCLGHDVKHFHLKGKNVAEVGEYYRNLIFLPKKTDS